MFGVPLLMLLFCSAPALQAANSSALERALSGEEGLRAVKRLQYALSHYLELGQWTEAAGLFTSDATGEFHAGDDLVTVQGAAALRSRFMAQAGRSTTGLARGQLNTHLILQPIVTLGADGSTAQGAWHEQALLGQSGGSASWSGGVYENDYVRQNGVWKIRHLRFFQQYQGAYADWGHKAPPRWNIPYHFEAQHVGVTIPASLLRQAAGDDAPTPAGLAALQQRVQRLEDETAVANLQHSYGYYLDRKLWDDVADLFATKASLQVAPQASYAGRTQIRAALETLYGPSPLKNGELFDHIQLATLVSVAPDGLSARARSLQLSMLGQNGEYARWESGVYEDAFIKEDGKWKIAAVHYYPRMVADYDKGWGEDAHAVSNAPVPLPSHDIAREGSPAKPRASASTSGTPTPAELQKRVDAAIAVDAVENLNSSYGYYIDESAWDQMADTFAARGEKEITAAGVYVGPDRIRKVLNLRGPRGGRTPNFFTIHQLTQPVIHISADGLSARARLRLFQCGGSADGTSGSWIGGIYENTAVMENGEWKFGVQELHHAYNASYRNGWARVGKVDKLPAPAGSPPNPRDKQGGGITQGLGGAASGPKVATDFPPDRPIAARQYAFPEIVEPPFHYVNPVSGRAPASMSGQ